VDLRARDGDRTRALDEAAALLDREAFKRRGVPPGPRADASSYRDYQRLAPLADLAPDAYLALPPGQQRRVRLAIDRELDARRARGDAFSIARTEAADPSSSEPRVRASRPTPETPLERRRRQLGQLQQQRSP
jgi:hypothetical protein